MPFGLTHERYPANTGHSAQTISSQKLGCIGPAIVNSRRPQLNDLIALVLLGMSFDARELATARLQNSYLLARAQRVGSQVQIG